MAQIKKKVIGSHVDNSFMNIMNKLYTILFIYLLIHELVNDTRLKVVYFFIIILIYGIVVYFMERENEKH